VQSVSVLFSEPKIPQLCIQVGGSTRITSFSALQRAENSSIWEHVVVSRFLNSFSALQRAENSSIELVIRGRAIGSPVVSVLFSEPKIPQSSLARGGDAEDTVSVLFSEPKIPQSYYVAFCVTHLTFQCSSASRKFLNSSVESGYSLSSETFQCSSASRKFLNPVQPRVGSAPVGSFSALQRAENSSIGRDRYTQRARREFQCSSASRKFLNSVRDWRVTIVPWGFSALQRAENSSIGRRPARHPQPAPFQCSSASRKFLNRC